MQSSRIAVRRDHICHVVSPHVSVPFMNRAAPFWVCCYFEGSGLKPHETVEG